MTTREMIITACFCVVMTLNVIVAIRHWRMVNLMNFTLRNFMESNRQFGELLDQQNERQRTPLAPE